jgi:hypothetical protein
MEENIEKDMSAKLIQDLGIMFASEGSKERRRYGLYKCGHCGEEFKAKTTRIKSGVIKSCGCLVGEYHGMKKHRFYDTYKNMMRRCYTKSNPAYKHYGERGISVCEEWQDIIKFVAWADSTYIEGYTLDRIDNDGNYEPNNCRWADNSTQILNRGIFKNNKSGFVGVYVARDNRWESRLTFNKVDIFLGRFNTIEEAAQARDNYIIENNLPHKLSTEY